MSDVASPINGGINDLAGDGVGIVHSDALTSLATTPNCKEPPTALVAGVMGPYNTGGLINYWQRSAVGALSDAVCTGTTGEPLLHELARGVWSTVFNDKDSDSVVPLTSEDAQGAGPQVPNVIHSSRMEFLGFSGPTELDGQSGVPSKVSELLNTPVTSKDTFRYLSH